MFFFQKQFQGQRDFFLQNSKIIPRATLVFIYMSEELCYIDFANSFDLYKFEKSTEEK